MRPLAAKILVRQYTKPEVIGSLVLPASFAKDDTFTWWEIVRMGPLAAETIGRDLAPDDIVRTDSWSGIYGFEEDGVSYFFIDATQVRAAYCFNHADANP